MGHDDPPGKAGSLEPVQSRAVPEASQGGRLRDACRWKLSICLQYVKIPSVTTAVHLKEPCLRQESGFLETLNEISCNSTLRSTPPVAGSACLPRSVHITVGLWNKGVYPRHIIYLHKLLWGTYYRVPLSTQASYKHTLLFLEIQTQSLKCQKKKKKPCGVVDSSWFHTSHINTSTRLWRNREGRRLSAGSSGLGGSPHRDRQGPRASSGGSSGSRTPLLQPLLDPQLFIPKLSFGAEILLEALGDKATHKADGRVSISGGITEIENASSTNVTQF